MKHAIETAEVLLARRIGFQSSATSAGRLERALRDGSADTGRPVADYVAGLAGDAVAFQLFVDRVTVQETSFFRHPEQFEALERTLLPSLPDPVLIWSAGCANGQEAYSLAMLLEEAGRPGSIIATDISSQALARTRAAHYDARELRGLSAARRERFVRPDGRGFVLDAALRARVTVARNNLAIDPPPFATGACHLVLCRNVLIYFSREEISAFLRKLHARLSDGAHLMIGGAEALWHVSDVFELDRSSGIFLYRRGTAAKPTARTPRGDVERPLRSPPRPPTASLEMPDPGEVRAAAEAAGARGEWKTAATAYRQLIYLLPDDVLGHIGLGVALEADDQPDGARRAFRAARVALARSDHDQLTSTLDGYGAKDVEQLLAAKLENHR
jgi:chemotaxis methyl-accepting protein methylase